MTDIWVCGSCHSINRQRGKRCYKCGAAQEAAATGEMANLRQEQAIISRTVVAYRPAAGTRSRGHAVSPRLCVRVGRPPPVRHRFLPVLRCQLAKLAATGTMDEKAILSRALAGAPWIAAGSSSFRRCCSSPPGSRASSRTFRPSAAASRARHPVGRSSTRSSRSSTCGPCRGWSRTCCTGSTRRPAALHGRRRLARTRRQLDHVVRRQAGI